MVDAGSALACGDHTHLGWTSDGPRCVADPSLSCGDGTHPDGGSCVVDVTTTCGTGTHLVFDGVQGSCVADSDLRCGDGTHDDGGSCVSDEWNLDGGVAFVTPTTWSPNLEVSEHGDEPELGVDSHGTIFAAVGSSVFRSDDGGASFQLLASLHATGDVTLLVDRADRVYVAWGSYEPISYAISLDGRTFSTPVQVTANESDRPWLTLAPDGAVVLSWEDDIQAVVASGELTSARSVDGGPFGPAAAVFPGAGAVSWSPLVFDAAGRPIAIHDDGLHVGCWHQSPDGATFTVIAPSSMQRANNAYRYYTALLVAQSTGRLVAGFESGDLTHLDVLLAESDDGGASWTTPHPLAVGWTSRETARWMTWLTVDERDRIHALWLGRLVSLPGPYWAVFSASSSDGVTFFPERVSDASFDWTGFEGGIQLEDFNSLVVRGGTRYALWGDARGGIGSWFSRAPVP